MTELSLTFSYYKEALTFSYYKFTFSYYKLPLMHLPSFFRNLQIFTSLAYTTLYINILPEFPSSAIGRKHGNKIVPPKAFI